MKVEIEIDESLVPEGYEVVAYRVAEGIEPCLQLIKNGTKAIAAVDAVGLPTLILKKKRWRAEYAGLYEYVNEIGQIQNKQDNCSSADNDRYKAGNYYKCGSDESDKAAQRVRAAYLGEGE